MKKTPLAITLCLVMGLFTTLALADDHAEKKSDDGWVSLIPEKGLDGWATHKNKTDDLWKNVDGVIHGENPKKNNSDLWTDKEFGDYELVVEYKNSTEGKHYDSGVFLRGGSHQVQIGYSGSLRIDLTGCIYCPKDGNGKYPQMPKEKVTKAQKPGEWNTVRIITKGKNIKTYLNGELINDYDGVKYPDKGKIGLQLHAGTHLKMAFRVIKIREIK